MEKLNALIVDDEKITADLLEQIIKYHGYNVVAKCMDAKCVFEIVNKKQIDLIFMDININGSIDGIQCAKKINENKSIPIIYTSALAEHEVIDEAIDENTIGYIIKPYGEQDVLISLKILDSNLKKQKYCTINNSIKALNNNYSFDTALKELSNNGEIISLSKKELLLLDLLVKNKTHVVSHEEIKLKIWNEKNISDSTIRETVARLKKKALNIDIKSAHGLGYILQ